MSLPDFLVIGAMKCATSTLHEQLALQPGFCMSEPKEPNYFSNDEEYARGEDWYRGLFAAARPDDLCGESSTHYTKLPTYPATIERMQRLLPNVKLIYVMRHPVDRLVSHYVHEWSERTIRGPIDEVVRECPRLTEYSRYARQLQPYIEAYGRQSILPVFFERMIAHPQAELERVCAFLGYTGAPRWRDDSARQNVSNERLRRSRVRDAIVWNPLVTVLRRKLVPQGWRDAVKKLWQYKGKPKLGEAARKELCRVFDEDLAVLGGWLGVELTCANFKSTARDAVLDFVEQPARC